MAEMLARQLLEVWPCKRKQTASFRFSMHNIFQLFENFIWIFLQTGVQESYEQTELAEKQY